MPATIAGLTYLILIGSRLLTDKTGAQAGVEKRTYRSEFRIEDSMLLSGCLTIDRLWQSVDWQTIVVLARSSTRRVFKRT